MIHELVDRHATADGARTAIRFEGRSISYAELAARSRELAVTLAAAGVCSGSRLGILMGNRPEWLLTAVAAARLGAVLFPLSTFLRERELRDLFDRAGIEAVVYSPRFSGTDYSAMLPDIANVLTLRPCLVSWPDDAAPPRASGAVQRLGSPLAARVDDEAIVFHTSGSTGEPKGVRHAHGPMARHAASIADRIGIGREDRCWASFPFFFSAGLMIFAYPTLAGGGTLVLEERFEPGRALRLLVEERCTVYQAWPHQVEAMMAEPGFRAADLGALTKSNGAKFLPHDAFLRHPHQAIDGWGMTETLTYCCSTRWDDPLEVRMASHGTPLPGVELRVVDPEDGRPLSAGKEGELAVRGGNLMLGYRGQPAGHHLDADGYFRSGDLGRIDPDGTVLFLGRLKEIIKTSGVNVSAAEIEKLLGEHPAVEAAHVVGVSDASRGELIAAFVVRRTPVGEEDLRKFVAERTARYKVPRWIHFTERTDLPETATGKIEKRRLRTIAEEKKGTL